MEVQDEEETANDDTQEKTAQLFAGLPELKDLRRTNKRMIRWPKVALMW